MTRSGTHSKLWVKIAIGSGILLGILLLVQTIATYFFVYDRIVHEEAAQEADRKIAALLRSAANAHVRNVHQLGPFIKELQRESPRQVAWIRLLDLDAAVIVESGEAHVKVPSPNQLQQQLEQHKSREQMTNSPNGRVLVLTSRFRFLGPPPMPRGGFDPALGPPREAINFAEVGIYVDGVTIHLGGLRQNLIVGCLAAVALLASMVLIAFFFNRYIRTRQLEQQVGLARSVQTDLLPSAERSHTSDNLEFAAAFLPAATIGGDFYDVFGADDGPVSIVLGDVAGKGISAALLMGVLHGAIRSMNWNKSAADQEAASQWLNQFLCEKTAHERFVSLFWASYLPETGTLQYVNAGHLPPLLIRAPQDGVSRIERLETGGPVLGILPRAQYRSATCQIDAGDVLVVYSDGVCEATDCKDQEFGETRIGEIVQQNMQGTPREICDAILREVSGFLGELKAHDDQTLLVIRMTMQEESVTPQSLGNIAYKSAADHH